MKIWQMIMMLLAIGTVGIMLLDASWSLVMGYELPGWLSVIVEGKI